MMGKSSGNTRCQTFPGLLIDHVQDPKWHPILSSGLHEIVAPDMLREERLQPDNRAIIEPQTTSFRLFLRDFQPLSVPDPFHAFVIDDPALILQQGSYSAVTVPSVLAGQINDPCGQIFFIIGWTFMVSLR